MEDKSKKKHHHNEEEHKHHHHHPHHCGPTGNPDCEGHTKGEKVLTESGLKAIIQKLTGRLMLAVGVVKAKGDAPLKLWKELDGDGILIRGMMTPVSESTDGWLSKEDYQKFLEALENIETIFIRLTNIDNTLEGLANSITSIREELATIQTHLTSLDAEIVNINTRIDELTTLVNNLGIRVDELNTLIEEVQATLGESVNDITASGDDALTLSATKSGQKATVTGSVVSASTTQRGAMTATDKTRLDEMWQKYQNGDFGCDCTHYEFGELSVELSYAEAGAEATSQGPSLSYAQEMTGEDGFEHTLTDGAEVTYSLGDAMSGVTINTSTGVLTFPENGEYSRKTLGTVTVSVTLNEKTATASATAYQSAKEVTYTTAYAWSGVSLSYPTAGATATSVSPGSLVYTLTKTVTGSDGSVETTTYDNTSGAAAVTYSISPSLGGVSINASTGEITIPQNTSASRRTIGAVTATIVLEGQTTTITTTVYQEAGEVTYTTEYSEPTVSLAYGTAPATATTLSPSYTYIQTRTRTGSDGSVETTQITEGGTPAFELLSGAASGVTIDGATGALTFGENTTESQITLGSVRLTVTMNGKSGTAEATAYQEAGTIEYGDVTVSLSYTDIPANGGTATPTVSYSQQRYVNGMADGDPITSGASVEYKYGAIYVEDMDYDSSTGVVTLGNENGYDSRRQVCTMEVTVTLNGKSGTAECAVYQAAAEGEDEITYSDVSVSLSYPEVPASGGETSPAYVYSQTRYVNGVADGMITSGGSLVFDLDNIVSGATVDSSTGVITVPENTDTSQRNVGKASLEVTLNGKTGMKTYDIVQAGAEDTELTYTDKYTWSNLGLIYPTAAAADTSVSYSSYSWHLERLRTYSDGTTETTTWDTWQATPSLSFALETSLSGVSIDPTTGVITLTENTDTSQRMIGTVSMTLTLEGQSVGVTAQVYQEAVEVTYGTPEVSLSYPTAPATAGTISPTFSYSQIRYKNGVADGEPITSGAEVVFFMQTGGQFEIDETTGVITFEDNETEEARTLGMAGVDVTMNGKTGMATARIEQAEPVRLPELYFTDFSQSGNQELTDAGLISVQGYSQMRHESGTAMTIGVSLPTGGTGVYTFNVGIWFDALENKGNVTLAGEAQYLCQYHKGEYGDHNLNGSANGDLVDIDHSGDADVAYGDGYYRLYISDVTLDLQTSSSNVTLLELDLLQYYVGTESGTTTATARANRRLQLNYVGTELPTSVEEFIANIEATLVEE